MTNFDHQRGRENSDDSSEPNSPPDLITDPPEARVYDPSPHAQHLSRERVWMRNTTVGAEVQSSAKLPNSHSIPIVVCDAEGVVALGEAELLDRRGPVHVRQ